MSQVSWIAEETTDRGREIDQARAELTQLAEQQGVHPVDDATELQGSPAPEDEGHDNVDELLRLLREWHNEELTLGG